ncbi:hypothetical protein M569_12678, partial [Genlisea aurea]
VCVIGAGSAGLVAARELRKEGLHVVVFEKNHDVGGQWLYDPNVDDDENLYGLCNVHSSVYASLRVASPREIMGFTDFPFTIKEEGDARRYPGHAEIQSYISDFCETFKLRDMIEFNTLVEKVEMLDVKKWLVRRSKGKKAVVEDVFDAVVVATGHYSQPKLPKISGMELWNRKQMHSHNYRVPDPFKNEIVVIVGSSLSARDISMELVNVAKEIHISARSPTGISPGFFGFISKNLNVHLHPEISSLAGGGRVWFIDGSSLIADRIIYCTGYTYSFPFLDTKGMVEVNDHRVEALYEHIFPPALAPSLSFVGIPKKVIGFPFFECQAKWIARVLSGKATLPTCDDMMESVRERYRSLEAAGIPKANTHDIGEFEYCDGFADMVGFPRLEEWRKHLCITSIVRGEMEPESYRESYEDDDEMLQVAYSSPHF